MIYFALKSRIFGPFISSTMSSTDGSVANSKVRVIKGVLWSDSAKSRFAIQSFQVVLAGGLPPGRSKRAQGIDIHFLRIALRNSINLMR